MNTQDELIELVEDAAWLEGRPVSESEARKLVVRSLVGPVRVGE